MICYFSATGNSRHVAERIAEAFGDQTLSIENAPQELVLKDGEFLGFVTPSNWNELPVLVREFIRKTSFCLAKGNYVFTVATFGLLQGFVCEDARRELAQMNIVMDAGFSVKMPDNWTPLFDVSDAVKIQRQVDEAEPQIDNVIAQIRERVKGNHSKWRTPYFLHHVTDALLHYERQTKFFAVDESRCNGCGACAKQCPVKAIEIQNQRPVWTAERCAICLGCLHRCPQFAIHYNNQTQHHGQYLHSKFFRRGDS